MAEAPEEVSSDGFTSDLFSQPPIDDCKVELAVSRRVMRKRTLRSSPSRNRLAISSPKSPLMRMAEMRRGGLHGKALRHSGKKGCDGLDLLSGRGKKGAGGRGSSLLSVIPECLEVGEGGLGGLGSEGIDAGVVNVSGEGEFSAGSGPGEGILEVAGGGMGDGGAAGDSVDLASEMEKDRNTMLALISSKEGTGGGVASLAGKAEMISAGLIADLALDLVSAQPL